MIASKEGIFGFFNLSDKKAKNSVTTSTTSTYEFKNEGEGIVFSSKM